MKTLKFLFCFFAAAALILACQKEVSHEAGNTSTSHGLLSGAGSGCTNSTIGGVYQKDTALNSSNYVDVQITVTTPGSYLVYTDTSNGMWFRATGNFSATGVQTVRLPGFGTPIATGTHNFNVYYDSSDCSFSITTIAGVGPAVYSLTGNGGTCGNASFQGTYTQGVATNASNTLTVEVTVTTPGTYTITATGDGVTWTKTGVFTTAGVKTVVLTSNNAAPTNAGAQTVNVVAGSSACTIQLTVGSASSAAVYTLVGAPTACSGAFSIQGTYTQNTALTAANTVTVQLNVTTPGSYSLTTNTQNGVSFSASGTFTASQTGLQTVVMTSNLATPPASGPFTYTVTGASTTCTFSITYAAAVIDYFPRTTNSNWSYEFDDDPTDSLLTWVIANTITAGTPPSSFNTFMYDYGGVDTFGYYRKSGSDYYHWVNLADYFGFDNDQWVQFIFLKDNQAAGFTWTTAAYAGTIGGAPVSIRIKFTILQQNQTISLTTSTGTASYPNTIVVKEQYEYDLGTGFQNGDSVFGFYEDYYSRNIGSIKEIGYDPSTLMPAFQFEVRRYVVY